MAACYENDAINVAAPHVGDIVTMTTEAGANGATTCFV